MDRINILIVDDHEIVRHGLRQLLETEPGYRVIGEVSSGLECMDLLESAAPDVIFMDVRMPGISGIEATRLISAKYPDIKIIILTIHDDEQLVSHAIQAGAKGFILKKISRDELIKVVREVAENRAYLDPQVTAPVFKHLRQKKTAPAHNQPDIQLTKRELEVMQALFQGKKDRLIAEDLYISEHTVRSHIKNIYRKLKVSSRMQAVTKALKLGIIQ